MKEITYKGRENKTEITFSWSVQEQENVISKTLQIRIPRQYRLNRQRLEKEFRKRRLDILQKGHFLIQRNFVTLTVLTPSQQA